MIGLFVLRQDSFHVLGGFYNSEAFLRVIEAHKVSTVR